MRPLTQPGNRTHRLGHTIWLAAVPGLLLAAACGESRAPTGMAPPAARYQTVADCQAQIDVLVQLTQTAPITGQNAEKDRTGLLGKLAAASAALGAGKNADAVQKLGDFVAKVQQLEAAGKLDAAFAEQLIAQANSAIACINAIGA